MVGNGMGAKNGVLFKTAVSLEETGKAQIVALDKTGTITRGEPRVTDLIPTGGISETELFVRSLCAREKKRASPLARAITQRAEQECLTAFEVERFEALPGNGLTASLDGRSFSASFKFISGQIAVSDETRKKEPRRLSEEGKTPLLFARGGALIGIIAVADVIRTTVRRP